MKLHKTRRDQRETYKYYDANGKLVIELKPGENDVTEADIRTLHLLDDKEVRSNLKEVCQVCNGQRVHSDLAPSAALIYG